MALQINTNVGALMASASASSASKSMATSMNRLATGMRINTAADDAAGVAIASRLTSEIRGTNQAVRNAADGQALIDTAEGAQTEIVNILQRMRELSVQAANDTNSSDDRLALNDEVEQLTAELDRIADTTTWAGQKLLDGSFVTKTLQIGADIGQSLNVSQKSMRASDIGEFKIDTTAVTMVAAANVGAATNTLTSTGVTVLGKDGTAAATVAAKSSAATLAAAINTDTSSTGVKASAHTAIRFSMSGTPAGQTSMSLQGGGSAVVVSATVTSDSDLSALLSAVNTYSSTTGVTAEFDGSDKSKLIFREANGDNINILDFTSTSAAPAGLTSSIEKQSNYEGTAWAGSPVTLTSGGAADSTIATGVVRMSSSNSFTISGDTGVATSGYNGASATAASTLSTVAAVSISTQSGATSAIGVIDTALGMVSESRAALGAVSNRLDSTISNLTNISANLEAGRSSIQDADFAAESTNLAKNQILSQASTAMLAQANASKQGVLQLLQG
jgi:flagellin